jgi:integrase
LTALASSVSFDPLKDKTYRDTALGRDVVDFLAWMELGDARPRTLDQYERDLARGCLMFPTKPLEEWEGADLLHVAKSFKPAERRVRVAAYRSFFRWARQMRRITVNPTDELPRMKQRGQKVKDVFSDEEIAVLEQLPLRDGALMQILFDVGLRKGEARHMRLAHFRVDRSEFAVLDGKGGKDRVVSAMTHTVARLNELALFEGLNPPDFLWYATFANAQASKIRRTLPVGEGTFDRWWRRCLTDAGVRYRNPHTTRHTFATRWLRRGGRLETLSLAMGHESIRTTFDLYGHLDTRDMAADLLLIEGGG